jgi:hypothetical protein
VLLASLLIFAQAQSSSDATVLLGIAAILGPVAIVVAAWINRARRSRADPSDLAGDALERVARLKADIAELTANLEACRVERRVMTSEARVKDMEIGSLQGRLADMRRRLEELEADRA